MIFGLKFADRVFRIAAEHTVGISAEITEINQRLLQLFDFLAIAAVIQCRFIQSRSSAHAYEQCQNNPKQKETALPHGRTSSPFILEAQYNTILRKCKEILQKCYKIQIVLTLSGADGNL